MIVHKKSEGIAHLIPLVFAVLLLLGVAGYLFYSSQQSEELSLYDSLIGVSGDVAGYEAPVPTAQITSIPKSECDIFVSPNGTGNGSSEASPMKMINEAVQRAQPGQAVCLKGGEYRQVVSIQKSGTASAPIKIGGYSGGGLPIVSGGVTKGDQYKLPNPQCQVLDGDCTRPNLGQQCKRPGCVNDPLFLIKGASNLKIIGIDVRGSSGRGFQMGSNSVNVSVDGMRTYHHWSTGFQISSQEPKWSSKNLDFNRIAIYDNIRGMAEKNIVGGGGGQIHAVDGAVFRNSAVFRNYGEGLNVGKAAKNVIVRDSIFWENAHTALYANGAITSAFDRNFLFCTGDKFAWLRAAPNAAVGHEDNVGAAITLRNERGVTGSHGVGTGTIASNNTVVGCSTTVTVAAQSGTTLSDVIVANNTLVSPRRPGKPNGPGITFGGNLSNILVANNVVAGGSINTYSNVNFVNNIATHGSARNGVRVVDPKFTKLVGLTEKLNPANMDPADYVIMAGSPAIGAGTKPNARNLVDNDLFGNTRGSNPIDLGSYEFGNAKNWPDVYGVLLAGATIPDDDDDPPADNDGDGIPNLEDVCPNIPQGPTPDPERPGCPLEEDDNPPADSDGDGVPNSSDVCPNVPKGPTPDPERLGCPLEDDDDPPADSDGDGVVDSEDACPNVHSGDEPDPARPGCPLEDGGQNPNRNILVNGNFNTAPTVAGEVARAWNFTKDRLGRATANLVDVTGSSLIGGKAVRVNIVNNPVVGSPALAQKNVNLEPNTQYRVSFAARATKPGRVNISFRDAGYIQNTLAPTLGFDVTTGWKRYTTVVTTKAYDTNKLAKVSLNIKLSNGESITIDNVRIIPVQ